MKPTPLNRAVFLSYASQDVEAARAISKILCEGGLEVWFDQGELRGGDAWDMKITQQIAECALFVPIISRNTDARPEGYFRREWALATDRIRDMADDEPFLVPIVIDDTPGETARVPRSFRTRQWVNLHGGEDRDTGFAETVKHLISRKSNPPLPRPSSRAAASGYPVARRPVAAASEALAAETAAPREVLDAQLVEVKDDVAGARLATFFFGTRAGLVLVLATVFAFNYFETALEAALKTNLGIGRELEYRIAAAMQKIEWNLTFERHDMTNRAAVYGYSGAYFFLYPALLLGLVAFLALRRRVNALRVFVLSLALVYAISLPFYFFFPIPERWAYPESEAILLSDLWTSSLIVFFRPFSGIDNSFPSFHVSSTVVFVLITYLYRVPLRAALACLSAIVVVSTFALGIHWIPDIIAGLGLGVVSVGAALKLERRYFEAGRPALNAGLVLGEPARQE